MAGEPNITLVGNITGDPELRFTPSGAAVADFRVASTPRTYDRQSGEWRDGEAMFINCSVWRQYAENVAESLQKGMRVIVQGRLKSRTFETRAGEQRTVFEIDADEVGPALRYATAKVTRVTSSGGGPGGGGGQRGGFNSDNSSADNSSADNFTSGNEPAAASYAGNTDPWAIGGQSSPGMAGSDPWATNTDEDPPF
jgi:single-strand DNA-binding protein